MAATTDMTAQAIKSLGLKTIAIYGAALVWVTEKAESLPGAHLFPPQGQLRRSRQACNSLHKSHFEKTATTAFSANAPVAPITEPISAHYLSMTSRAVLAVLIAFPTGL
jgi:hypothetical protein